MSDIAARAGKKIVDAKNFVTGAKQRLAQMASDKAGAARNQNALHRQTPCFFLIFRIAVGAYDVLPGAPPAKSIFQLDFRFCGAPRYLPQLESRAPIKSSTPIHPNERT